MPDPRSTDETPNTLPDPELNPLLNPVLGAHMGRWAEAYFTAPPEKREEAVAELLRELRGDPPRESAAVASDHGHDANVHGINDAKDLAINDLAIKDHGIDDHGVDDAMHDSKKDAKSDAKNIENSAAPVLEEAPVASSAPATELALTCDLCGHQNGAEQLFCGMCGSRMQARPAIVIPQIAEAEPSTADWSKPEASLNGHFRERGNEPDLGNAAAVVGSDTPEHSATEHVAVEPSSTESAWTLPHRSLPSFAIEPEPESVPYRYRAYIGAVLAILLVLLLYMAWRGTQAISSTEGTHSLASRAIPPAPPAEVPAPAVQPASPAAAPSATPPSSDQPSASASAKASKAARPEPSRTGVSPSKAARPAAPVRSEKPRASAARKSQPATRRKSVVTMAASSSPMPNETSGAEELSSAERYLNGTPRDSKEAAQWLWKSVGKGNLGATMALSDLYLRGDGVTKSCDQARLLLDAAARKGGRAAAERLRNLQAFGCN
jgi:hypothetical protein